MKIVVLLFENFTALDIIGPYEVLTKLPDTEVLFAGVEKTAYHDAYGLALRADYSIDEISEADILLIPGGSGIYNYLSNDKLIAWIQKLDAFTRWTVSVCSGSILLAHTGLLDNRSCTTYWQRKDLLRKYNVNVTDDRYVHDGKYITSAGVSAGIDMALYLVSLLKNEKVAKMVQLGIEYNPKPPFDFEIMDING